MQLEPLPEPIQLVRKISEHVVYYGNIECYHSRWSSVVKHINKDTGMVVSEDVFCVTGLSKLKLF
jgi:hypothetical protein